MRASALGGGGAGRALAGPPDHGTVMPIDRTTPADASGRAERGAGRDVAPPLPAPASSRVGLRADRKRPPCVPALQAVIVHVAPINQFFSCEAIDIAHGHCQPLGMLEWGVILAVATFIFLLVEREKFFILPHILSADWHFPHIFHHVEGEEGKWHFLATSASFHGVSHLKTTHTPAAGSSVGAFSSQNLAAKLQSKRSLVASAGGAAASASASGSAGLEVRAPL